jgi:hypothetical protein
MPSRRVLGALVAAVFAIGLLAGAALGPAPEGSLADSSTIVQRVIALLAARGEGGSQASAPTTSGASTATGASATLGAGAAPTSKAKPGFQPAANRAATPSSPESSSAGESAAGSEHASSGGPNKGESGASRPARLPPIQHVWLIMLGGSTIADAETTPTGYPYLVGQLVKQGALLRSYSALDAYELAGDATLLPGGVGASLSVIQEPGCEGAAAGGAGSCPQGAQASPAEADQFLQGTVGPILSSPTYRENGLIVITFVSAQASAGASASTLSLQPVAGALLLSPLLRGGTGSTSTFDSLSPRTSLANIFRP